jgi:hypothetical protein
MLLEIFVSTTFGVAWLKDAQLRWLAYAWSEHSMEQSRLRGASGTVDWFLVLAYLESSRRLKFEEHMEGRD